MNEKCPQCHGDAIIEGKVYNQIDYVSPPAFFRPVRAPFYAIFKTNVEMDNIFFACPFCGFIWSKMNNQKLQQIISSRKG